mgnify:CR=1 FL=1|tara:strand:- start:3102 stop:4265 length:1164 start_codon:yes stop_codon:yes gene_type:complete
MKILSLSDLKETGGASIAKTRIASSFQDLGHDVVTVSSDGAWEEEHSVLSHGKKFDFLSLFFQRHPPLFKKLRNFGLCKHLCFILNEQKPDIIHIHNLHSTTWPLSLVTTALKFAPVFWTLHDCFSFSGSFCPTHTPPPKDDFLNEIKSFWHDLDNLKNSHSLTGVAPSNWIKSEACNSNWKNSNITKIHNPIPNSYFEQIDQFGCKKALGLKDGKPTILFISGNLNAEHKGGWMIEEIIRTIPPNKVQFLLVGDGCPNVSNSWNVRHIGFIQDEITLQFAYNAADILIHPAPIDNLPNTVAESMSCGTPVLAFKTGGIPEMIVPDKSGWLVDKICNELLVEKLLSILALQKYKDIRTSVKQHARNLFDQKLIANQYLDIFNSNLLN